MDKPNEDALREWRTFSGKDAKKIAAEERRLGVQQKYLDACCWADLYGGAAMLMITGQDLSKPLNLDKVKKGGLKNIVVFDRWDIQPSQFNFTDPLAPNWMLPEVYTVVNGQQPIHYSHVIRRTGARLPRRMAQFEQGWGDSRLRRCMEDLRDVVATKGGIASLVLEANVDTISVKGLQGALSSAQCDQITERYRLFGMLKGIINLGLLDQDNEVYDRKSIAFSGLSQIMEQFMVWTAGAAEMPVTELWGQSAAGLSATGDGDLKTYHGTIKGKQDGQMRRDLERLDEVMIRSALGTYPEDIEFEGIRSTRSRAWKRLRRTWQTPRPISSISRAASFARAMPCAALRPRADTPSPTSRSPPKSSVRRTKTMALAAKKTSTPSPLRP